MRGAGAATGKGGLTGALAMIALIGCTIVPDASAPPSGSATPSGSAAGDLAILTCPGSGSELAVAEPGQPMLVTGRSADGAFLRVHVPGPVVNEGWAPSAALEVDSDVAGLPTSRCGGSSAPPSREGVAGFRVVIDGENQPKSLGPPPGDQLIQLVSFDMDAPPPASGEAAPWWSSTGIPRVDHITQFDGGPLQGVNGVPAAGAMLARLAFGIVTTGSQLRALASDQENGTSLADLVETMSDRADVQISAGYLSADGLRRLLAAGAGAVVIVDYGIIPLNLRQQAGFTGDHAMYVDGLRLSADGIPAYYVMDPIGLAWEGYRGEWLPADVVDRAAMAFGGRTIVAAWAFAGGVNPATPPTGAGPLNAPIGDNPSLNVPEGITELLAVDAVSGGFRIEPNLAVCLEPPVPDYCPAGVRAVYQPPASGLDTVLPPSSSRPVELLYANPPQPGVATVIFSAPPGVEPTFSYWPADGSGPVLRAEPAAATIGGKQVWMVTVPIPQAGTFYFLASSSQGGTITATEVGAISFGN